MIGLVIFVMQIIMCFCCQYHETLHPHERFYVIAMVEQSLSDLIIVPLGENEYVARTVSFLLSPR